MFFQMLHSFEVVGIFITKLAISFSFRAVVRFFKSEGADSNKLSFSLSVLFSENPNSGGAKAPPAPPLTTALQCSLVF